MVFSLTDETYSLLCSAKRPEDFSDCEWKTASFLSPVSNSLLRAIICFRHDGQLISFNTAGIDFAMTALFVVICVEQWEAAKTHLPADRFCLRHTVSCPDPVFQFYPSGPDLRRSGSDPVFAQNPKTNGGSTLMNLIPHSISNHSYVLVAIWSAPSAHRSPAGSPSFSLAERRSLPRTDPLSRLHPSLRHYGCFSSLLPKRGYPLSYPYGLPELISTAAVVVIHRFRRNTLLSIRTGAVLYMILIEKVF